MFNSEMISLVGVAFWESIYMTIISSFFAYVIGLPLGLILVATDKDGIAPAPLFNQVLGIIINILRSIPFLILLVAMMPITQAVVGTVIGAKATIVVLVVAAAPFIARLVESSLKEVDEGVVEAARSMGAGTFQIVWKVLLVEGRTSLLTGATIAIGTILGYSAMAGCCGGGGLGAIAIQYGYYRYETGIMIVTVILLIVLFQIFQSVGMHIASKLDKRK